MKIIAFILLFFIYGFVFPNQSEILNQISKSQKNPLWFDLPSERIAVIDFYNMNKKNFPPALNSIVATAYFFYDNPQNPIMYASEICELFRNSKDYSEINNIRDIVYIAYMDLNDYRSIFNISYDHLKSDGASILTVKLILLSAIEGDLWKDQLYSKRIEELANTFISYMGIDKDVEFLYIKLIEHSCNIDLSKVLLNKLGNKIYNNDISLLSLRYLLLNKYFGDDEAKEFVKYIENNHKKVWDVIKTNLSQTSAENTTLTLDEIKMRLRKVIIECVRIGI